MQPQPSVNYERFPSEYFSGSDIRVYFEDILIDEITDLQFVMEERVLPIHGYNSFTYDAVARGSRIVQGTFAINFKEADYLRKAIREVIEDKSEFDISQNYIAKEQDVNEGYLEDELEERDKLYEYLERGWSTKFDRMATEYEDKIWGGVNKNINYSRDNKAFFQSKDNSDETFDILITYGPYSKDRLYAKEGFGNQKELNYYQNVNNGTVRSINNIQITGLSQVIDGSGKPIKEVYNFLAQDLDRA